MATASVRHAVRWIEGLALLLGVGCLVWVSITWAHAAVYQSHAKDELDHMLPLASVSGGAGRPGMGEPSSRADLLIGLLEIPRLGVSVAVLEGEDERILRVAVGHLPDTALPWEVGNTALAGHRDMFFRPIEDIRLGDEVRLATHHGEFEFRVRRLAIVDPDNVWVLNPSDHVGLTLITCYPFRYVGPAPKRYIVQAERLASANRSRS